MFRRIKERKIKIAVIGCGRVSRNHFNSIIAHKEEMELVAICDKDREVSDKFEKEFNVPAFYNIDDLVRDTKVDVVSLCTPSGLHPAHAIIVAEAGINVITEKPMATRWKDGLKMVKACDDANVRLFVVKQNRHNSTIQLLKRAIDEKRFGKIYLVSMNVCWTRPQSYYDSAKWRGTWELDGGAFMNQASHYIDLLEWLFGPIADIHAMTGTLGRNIEVEDTGVMNIRWRSGAMGSVAVTMLTYPKNFEGSVTIIGEKGTVRVGGVAVNEILHWEFQETKGYDAKVYNASYQTTSVYGFGHPLYYKNVIDVLRGRAEPETDGREGLKTLEVLIAAYLSARDNKTVSLPLEY